MLDQEYKRLRENMHYLSFAREMCNLVKSTTPLSNLKFLNVVTFSLREERFQPRGFSNILGFINFHVNPCSFEELRATSYFLLFSALFFFRLATYHAAKLEC